MQQRINKSNLIVGVQIIEATKLQPSRYFLCTCQIIIYALCSLGLEITKYMNTDLKDIFKQNVIIVQQSLSCCLIFTVIILHCVLSKAQQLRHKQPSNTHTLTIMFQLAIIILLFVVGILINQKFILNASNYQVNLLLLSIYYIHYRKLLSHQLMRHVFALITFLQGLIQLSIFEQLGEQQTMIIHSSSLLFYSLAKAWSQCHYKNKLQSRTQLKESSIKPRFSEQMSPKKNLSAFESFVNLMPQGIVLLNKQKQLLIENNSMQTIFGGGGCGDNGNSVGVGGGVKLCQMISLNENTTVLDHLLAMKINPQSVENIPVLDGGNHHPQRPFQLQLPQHEKTIDLTFGQHSYFMMNQTALSQEGLMIQQLSIPNYPEIINKIKCSSILTIAQLIDYIMNLQHQQQNCVMNERNQSSAREENNNPDTLLNTHKQLLLTIPQVQNGNDPNGIGGGAPMVNFSSLQLTGFCQEREYKLDIILCEMVKLDLRCPDGLAVMVVVQDVTPYQQSLYQYIREDSKLRMLGSVSHELKTPLNIILQLVEVLAYQIIKDDFIKTHYLFPSLCQLEIMNYTLNDILDIIQIQSQQFVLNAQRFKLKQMLHQCMALFYQQCQQKNIRLTMDYDNKIPKAIASDPIRVKQIVINLLNNAIKYTFKGSIVIGAKLMQITVPSSQSSSHPHPHQPLNDIYPPSSYSVQITVKDSGIGIAQDVQQDIMNVINNDNVYQLRNVQKRGCGLGLSASIQLMKKLNSGQHIFFESLEGHGSTFRFEIQNIELEKSSINQLNVSNNIFFAGVASTMRLNNVKVSLQKASQHVPKQESFHDLNKMNIIYKSNFDFIDNKKIPELSLSDQFSHSNSSCMINEDEDIISRQSIPEFPPLNCMEDNFIAPGSLSHRRQKKKQQTQKQCSEPQQQTHLNSQAQLNSIIIQSVASLVFNKRSTLVSCENNNCAQILIVDDQQFNLMAMQNLLGFYNLLSQTALNGQEAVDVVLQRYNLNPCCKYFKLIFMDIDMPVKNGYQASKEISDFYKDKKFTNNPIICACTAYVDKGTQQMFKYNGITHLLQKPVFRNNLENLLKSVGIIEKDTN